MKYLKAIGYENMKIAMAQIQVIPGRPDLNINKIITYIRQAKEGKADMVIFP